MSNDPTQYDPWKEKFNSCFRDPTHDKFRDLILNEAIEDNDLEFKRQVLPYDLFAKHVLAMANSRGGMIVFGLEEQKNSYQLLPSGISEPIDLTDIDNNLKKYLPKNLLYKLVPTTFKDDKYPDLKDRSFLAVIIISTPLYTPFLSLKSGSNIDSKTIYIRRNRATHPANYDELQELLNRRIETEYSSANEISLNHHLNELEDLYSRISKNIFFNPMEKLSDISNLYSSNPHYPKETYDEFICRLIDMKKKLIIDRLNHK